MASMLRGAEYDTPLNFEDEWGKIHRIVLALITQERVTQLEWQDLFLAVYKIHSWVEDGKKKLHCAIDYNVKEYVRMARERINCHIERGDQALLRAYIQEWTKFYQQTAILPLPFMLLVLKYIANKDVFMRFHKAHLSRRLILDMSADQEKEEAMVNKLRECGMPAEHVNKLFRMLQDIEVNKDLNSSFKKSLVGTNNNKTLSDLINIKILNGGAWGRGGVGAERVRVSLPRELEEFVPEVEAFYKKHHNGRKLNWMHHWSSGTIIFGTSSGGRFDLEVTTFQMAVLFCWNDRAQEKISFESLRLATELPDTELARTLFSLVAYPKVKSQILLCDAPYPINPRDFTDSTLFFINHDFHFIKNGKEQHRGRINLIGRLQLSMESSASKEHEDIVALREFRVQEATVKIMKMRKTITSAQLQTELVEMLKPMFIPNRKLIKEQIDWLIENRFIERKDDDINTFVYVS
ncbi:cullin family protein [Necator americanus]|uniref:Cullin family protein n=1 Tax=Necator americanus TaxID=51031 RepID=W2TPK1_NECAM|nr:cullin family protein [Necator americanus]ETN83703.1 cullin family protein [Necator americanus]